MPRSRAGWVVPTSTPNWRSRSSRTPCLTASASGWTRGSGSRRSSATPDAERPARPLPFPNMEERKPFVDLIARLWELGSANDAADRGYLDVAERIRYEASAEIRALLDAHPL